MSWTTQTEAAAVLGCSIRTIRRRIRAGLLKTSREGRNILVDVDTDRAMATVTQVGRQLAEVGAAAAIQKKHDTDTLSAIQATFTDMLSALSDSRRALEQESMRTRGLARTGWAVAAALAACLFLGVWLYNAEKLGYLNRVHDLEARTAAANAQARTAMISAEVRHIGELATAQARYEAASETLRDSLAGERERVADLDDRIAALNRTVAERSTELESALVARDRLVSDVQRLSNDLRYTRAAATVGGTLKGIWSVVQLASQSAYHRAQLDSLRDEAAARDVRDTVPSVARIEDEKELLTVEARCQGESEVLTTSLTHERHTVERLQRRIDVLSEKLVAVVMERGRLMAQRDELAEEAARLREGLRAARQATDLTEKLEGWWSAVRTALAPDSSPKPEPNAATACSVTPRG